MSMSRDESSVSRTEDQLSRFQFVISVSSVCVPNADAQNTTMHIWVCYHPSVP